MKICAFSVEEEKASSHYPVTKWEPKKNTPEICHLGISHKLDDADVPPDGLVSFDFTLVYCSRIRHNTINMDMPGMDYFLLSGAQITGIQVQYTYIRVVEQ